MVDNLFYFNLIYLGLVRDLAVSRPGVCQDEGEMIRLSSDKQLLELDSRSRDCGQIRTWFFAPDVSDLLFSSCFGLEVVCVWGGGGMVVVLEGGVRPDSPL